MDNTDKQFVYYYYEVIFKRDDLDQIITAPFGARSFEEVGTKIKEWIERSRWTGRVVNIKEIAQRLLTEDDFV